MANPSRPPTFKAFGVKRQCYGCGRQLTTNDSLWFISHPVKAVLGRCCFHRYSEIIRDETLSSQT